MEISGGPCVEIGAAGIAGAAAHCLFLRRCSPCFRLRRMPHWGTARITPRIPHKLRKSGAFFKKTYMSSQAEASLHKKQEGKTIHKFFLMEKEQF